MHIHESRVANVLILSVAGRLDTPVAVQLERKLQELIQAGERVLVLNCSKLDYISSSGLRVIITVARSLQRQGGGFALSSPSAHFQELLELTQMDRVLEIYANDGEAAVAMARQYENQVPDAPPAPAEQPHRLDPLQMEEEDEEWQREQRNFEKKLKQLREERDGWYEKANRAMPGNVDRGLPFFMMTVLVFPFLSLLVSYGVNELLGFGFWAAIPLLYLLLFAAVYGVSWSQRAAARERVASLDAEIGALQKEHETFMQQKAQQIERTAL